MSMANNIDSIKNVGEENNPASNQSLPRLWNANYIKVWSANFMIFFSFMLVMPLLPLYLSEQYGAGKHTIGLILSGYTITATKDTCIMTMTNTTQATPCDSY